MTENIRLEFVDMINENEWMDDFSKQKAIQKVFLNLTIGFLLIFI